MRAGGASQYTSSERLPIIFGVSGHRDLVIADVPQLRKHLLQIFAAFRAAYPHTPFRLLSPLAEGADRLVAEVALASEVDLFVPMPMKQQEYERDFPTAKSLAEFRTLLAMAEDRWEMPTPANSEIENRTRLYAELGDFIARHCHVLLLLWDGSDNKKVGGTAWVKKRREHWVTAASSPSRGLVPPCYGPTIQVVTPRVSGRLPRPRPATMGELPPSAEKFAITLANPTSKRRGRSKPQRLPLYQDLYWAIDRFNADVPGSVPAKKRKKRQSATRSRL